MNLRPPTLPTHTGRRGRSVPSPAPDRNVGITFPRRERSERHWQHKDYPTKEERQLNVDGGGNREAAALQLPPQ